MIAARRLSASAGVILALATAMAVADESRIDRFGPFALVSDGAGEQSSTNYQAEVRTSAMLKASYRAPRTHCSPVRISIMVDDRQVSVPATVAPGQDSPPFDFGPQASGAHRLEVRAEGISGGCNTGRLQSWGGTLTVWTSGPDGGALMGPQEHGEVVFAVGQIGYSRSGGDVFDFVDEKGMVYRLAGTRATQPLSDDGYFGADWLRTRLAGALVARQLPPDSLVPFRTAALRLASGAVVAASNREPGGRRLTSAALVYVWDSGHGAYRRILLAERGQTLWSSAPPPHWDEGSKEAALVSDWLLHLDDGVRDR